MLVYIVDWHMKDLKLDQKYKKYFRKSSIKKKELGNLFLEEIQKKESKIFLRNRHFSWSYSQKHM